MLSHRSLAARRTRAARRRAPVFPAVLAVSFAVLAAAPEPARPAAVRPSDDAELVAEFRRYYGKDRSERERIEAVRVLAGVDSLSAAQVLLPALEDEAFPVRRAAIEVIGGMGAEGVATWLIDEVLGDRKLRKRVVLRAGAAEALGRTGAPGAYAPLIELLDEREDELRLAAARALGALGDPRAAPALAALARGEDAALAMACLQALVALGPSAAASEAVVGALAHADPRVRGAAITAAVPLRVHAAVRPLIEMLGEESGRLAGDAYAALREMTLRQFPDDPASWRAWWDRNESVFELPDPAQVAAARERERREGTRYAKGGQAFLGVETKSEHIMFVIDVSGSMETRFDHPERLASTGRTYDSLQRLAIVKQELIATIDGLPDTTEFNIIAFATEAELWKRKPVRANVLNKNNARTWIERLHPLGGEASSFRATAGLSLSDANLGATNTYLALMTAFGEPVDDTGDVGFVTAPDSDIDTIFFLTDGDPTIGKTVDMNEIRSEVQRVNAYRGVVIHVIFVGAVSGKDLERLAAENGGVFVAIGG